MRACQGHSVSHVIPVRDTPEYAAHGTYYDFYESILRQPRYGGWGTARAVLPPPRPHGRGAPTGISGMRSDCDLAIWISTREAAAAGVQFYRSANSVLLTDAAIDPAFFHSIQVLRSAEVLTPMAVRRTRSKLPSPSTVLRQATHEPVSNSWPRVCCDYAMPAPGCVPPACQYACHAGLDLPIQWTKARPLHASLTLVIK